MGVTGARDADQLRCTELVERLRSVTDMPVGVGLGVSNGDQAAEVAAFADAVIVGSALVRCLLDAARRTSGRRRRPRPGPRAARRDRAR